jgi:hypothetical protein
MKGIVSSDPHDVAVGPDQLNNGTQATGTVILSRERLSFGPLQALGLESYPLK